MATIQSRRRPQMWGLYFLTAIMKNADFLSNAQHLKGAPGMYDCLTVAQFKGTAEQNNLRLLFCALGKVDWVSQAMTYAE